jgi:hypothetical protein
MRHLATGSPHSPATDGVSLCRPVSRPSGDHTHAIHLSLQSSRPGQPAQNTSVSSATSLTNQFSLPGQTDGLHDQLCAICTAVWEHCECMSTTDCMSGYGVGVKYYWSSGGCMGWGRRKETSAEAQHMACDGHTHYTLPGWSRHEG